MKLSVVVITFNEEKNIKRCLESVKNIADEIVVLDSFSTDKTLEIVKGENVVVQQRAWTNYSDAKNYATSLTTGDYIFSIDADEALNDELVKNINALKKDSALADCYEVSRLTNYCGQWIYHCGWYPEYKIRLFRKDSCTWHGSIHEELKFIKDSKPGKIRGNLLHYSFPTVDSHLKKAMLYAHLTSETDFNKGKKNNFLYHGLIKPWIVFLKKYFFQLGILDGYYGFIVCIVTAFFYFLRYVNYRNIKNQGTSI